MTRLTEPRLRPERCVNIGREGVQLDLFKTVFEPVIPTRLNYEPIWLRYHRRVYNRDRRVWVPPTAIQMIDATEYMKKHHAPVVAARLIEAMQFLMHGMPLSKVPLHMRRERIFVNIAVALRMLKQGASLRGIWRELKIRSMLVVNAPPVALGYCQRFLNGF